MHLEIPRAIGFEKENHLVKGGPNIILAQDSHVSWEVMKNNLALYVHLAEKFDLKVVGVEACDRRAAELYPRFGNAEETMYILEEEFKNSEGSFRQYPGLLGLASSVLGRNLIIADSGADRPIGSIWNAFRWFRDLPRRERSALRGHLDDAIENTALNLPEIIRAEVAFVLNGFSVDQDWTVQYKMRKGLGMIRTRIALDKLLEEMQLQKVDMAFMIRGADHTDEFIEIADQREIGYLNFQPFGMGMLDPRMYREYFHDVDLQAAGLVTEAELS